MTGAGLKIKAFSISTLHGGASLKTKKCNLYLYTPYDKWEAFRQSLAKGIDKHHMP